MQMSSSQTPVEVTELSEAIQNRKMTESPLLAGTVAMCSVQLVPAPENAGRPRIGLLKPELIAAWLYPLSTHVPPTTMSVQLPPPSVEYSTTHPSYVASV